jgi:cysteine desulfurase
VRAVYLDNNASSPILPPVLEAMRPWLLEAHGNPSSLHARGRAARAAVEAARAQVARLLGAAPAEIVFTSGGTEGDNAALRGLARPGDHVITCAVEHHAVLSTCKRLERQGCAVTVLAVDGQGRVDPDAVRRALRPETALVSVMLANNETGVIQPVEELGRIAAEADVWLHTDAVQAVGKIPVDVGRLRCDALTLSGHKLHGPQGTGALYVRRGTPLRPLLLGGGQEGGLRAGTENVAGIVGLGAAAELCRGWLDAGGAAALAALRDRLEAGLLAAVDRAAVNGGAAARVPNTTSLAFDCVAGRALVVALDLLGVCASTGSACSAGSSEPPYVLLAMGLPPERAHASVRLSLGKQSTAEDVDRALDVLPGQVAQLRALSPLWAARARGGATSP